MGKLRTEAQRSLQSERQKAVDGAWKAEVELVRQGKGTRQWSADEQREILANGKVSGYYGHHMQSVKTNPENAANKDNIQFLNYDEHINGAHQKNPRENPTNGYYDPKTGQMHEFKDGKLVPITPMELENQGFTNLEERENGYKQGVVDRYNAKLDKRLAEYQKNLEQREDLSAEQKNTKYETRAAKYETNKEEFRVSMFQEGTVEKLNNNEIDNSTKLDSEKIDINNENSIEINANMENSSSSQVDTTNDNISDSESLSSTESSSDSSASSGNDGGMDY